MNTINIMYSLKLIFTMTYIHCFLQNKKDNVSSCDQIVRRPIQDLDVHKRTKNDDKQNFRSLGTTIRRLSDTVLNGIAFADDEEEEELDYIQRYKLPTKMILRAFTKFNIILYVHRNFFFLVNPQSSLFIFRCTRQSLQRFQK